MRRRAAVLIGVAILAGAARARAGSGFDEETFFAKQIPSYTIPTPTAGGDTIIGRAQPYRIRKGDTLMDLARYFDLGYNEILDANPGIDPWVPPAGAIIVLPTEWILPCCTYQGVIVNIPEMRLFYMRRAGADTVVYTYPVGLGRDDWQTPSGKFRIIGKTVNPQWNIPESIRKEHIKERNDPRTFIPGGADDNPLGKYRFELSLPMYRIHGTDIPWGVGMQVSHGCVRLYPEDIERMFPLVPVGTTGEFVYQPVKIGRRGGVVYVETHEDIYGSRPALYKDTAGQLDKMGLTAQTDQALVLQALEDSGGMPYRVSPDPDAPTLAMAGPNPDDRRNDRTPDQDEPQAGDD
jgi:L,D-transpeptidase ErfK/SrfK